MTEPQTPRHSRGRVVMLAANHVVKDSRIQKQARSAAQLGWEVIVLGMARPGTPKRFEMNGARVRLIDVHPGLNQRHHKRRSAALRSPLAYLQAAHADYRWHLVRARQSDLRISIASAASASGSSEGSTSKTLKPGSHFVRRAYLALLTRWVDLRRTKTQQHVEKRALMDNPLDRATTQFWRRVFRERSWRQLDPSLWDADLAFAPVIQRLRPDIIHANDFHMLGVGSRAKIRLRAVGKDTKLVWDAHEYLAGMKPWNAHPRWLLARLAYQQEYAPCADALITVSETLGDLLVRDYALKLEPKVVLNAPIIDEASVSGRRLRDDCGLDPDVPLMVYSGGIAPQRGVETVVDALPQLLGVHLALVVANRRANAVVTLLRRADELGVADRVHVVDYVPVTDIVSFLSSADVGLIPILHYPNHEIALITKFLEYSQARLPIVVSDVKTMAETVQQTGQGEVFTAEDPDSFAVAVGNVLAHKSRYIKAYDAEGLLESWTWNSAAAVLDEVYENLHPSGAG